MLLTQPQRGSGRHTIQTRFPSPSLYTQVSKALPASPGAQTRLGVQEQGPAEARELQQLSRLSPVTHKQSKRHCPPGRSKSEEERRREDQGSSCGSLEWEGNQINK